MSMYSYMPYYRIQILKIHLQLISLGIGEREISAPQSFVQFFHVLHNVTNV
jgi:hypothetical protein